MTILINFTMDVATAFYLYLGRNKKFFNSALKNYTIGNYFENTLINLHYTFFFTRTALNLCSSIMLKNGIVMFISASIYSSKFKNVKAKNINFWLGKWDRGGLSNYRYSNALVRGEPKNFVRKFKFPSFVIIVDPISLSQPISSEAKYLGIFSFSFIDTGARFSQVSHWALGNTKSYYSNKFYYLLIRSVAIKSQLMKANKFLLNPNA